MGIRSFSNCPCDTCKCDTLHRNLVCSVCGTIKLSQTEQRRNSYKRIAQKYENRYGPNGIGNLMSKIRKDQPSSLQKIKPDREPKSALGNFGKGRERKRV